jgi:hypothetical protein
MDPPPLDLVEHVKTSCKRGHRSTPTVGSLEVQPGVHRGQPVAGARGLNATRPHGAANPSHVT